MPILLLYLLGIALLSALLRKRSAQVRGFLIVGYSYLFIIPLYYFAQLPQDASPADALNLLLRSAYQAPEAIAFSADLSLFNDPAITLLFYIASIYTAGTVLIAIFRVFSSLANRLRMLGRREVFVICGEPEDAKRMVQEIRAKVRRAAVIFVPQKSADETADVNALVTIRAWDKLLRPGKKYHIILLPDAQNRNLCRLDELEKIGERMPKLRVTAFLENDILRYENLSYPHLNAYLVSREQLLIRRFLMDHLPLRALRERAAGEAVDGVWRPARPFSLCILGFGALSREFLLATWENAAFQTGAQDGRGLEALIVDKDAASRRVSLFLDVPQLEREPAFTWLDAAPDSEEGIRAVLERLETLDQILLASDDTRLNLDMAMRLLRMFRRRGMEENHPQLVVALFEKAEGDVAFLSKEPGVAFLQSNSTQFTYKELVLRETDEQAEALHRQYSKTSLHSTNWNQIGTFQQNANRAVVWDIPNKLLLAEDLAHKSAEEKEAAYWRLAQYEHLRWCVFQYTHGWTPLPREELTDEEIRACATKRAGQKLHACLTPWDKLDALPQARPGQLKYYDYENVIQLFEPKDEV